MTQNDPNDMNHEEDPPSESAEGARASSRSDDEVIPESVRRRLETFVPELVRRTFAAGMGAVFTTEDSLRKLSKEIPLPKEVAGYLANTASTTKDEFMRILANETREFLQTVDVASEIAKILTLVSLEVKTEIKFKPSDAKAGGVEPDVKADVRLKRNRERAKSDSEGSTSEGKKRRRFSRRDSENE